VVFGEIKPSREHSDPEYLKSIEWLEKEVGFYPLFLAVGTTDEDLRMTGYQDNWRVKVASSYKDGKQVGEYRKKGEFPNQVLFSFNEVDGIFTDYQGWHIALNSAWNNYNISKQDKRYIFKYSWPRSKWIRKALDDAMGVQLVAPRLDLRLADRVMVRNNTTKKQLEETGFNNIEVKRITLEDSLSI